MGDVMLLGVLRMPYDMAMGDDIARIQYHARGLEAAARIEADQARIEALEAENLRLSNLWQIEHDHAKALAAEVAEVARLTAALSAADTYIDRGLYEKARNITRANLISSQK